MLKSYTNIHTKAWIYVICIHSGFKPYEENPKNSFGLADMRGESWRKLKRGLTANFSTPRLKKNIHHMNEAALKVRLGLRLDNNFTFQSFDDVFSLLDTCTQLKIMNSSKQRILAVNSTWAVLHQLDLVSMLIVLGRKSQPSRKKLRKLEIFKILILLKLNPFEGMCFLSKISFW